MASYRRTTSTTPACCGVLQTWGGDCWWCFECLTATPYHANVPSFGEWGYIVASRRPYRLPTALPAGLRFLDVASLPTLFDFPLDMARLPAEVNRLSNQLLVTTYEREWGRVMAR